MPIFHFDLVDGEVIADVTGCECADLFEAQQIADGLALRLSEREPQLLGLGFAMSVKSEDGEELYRAELDTVRKLTAH